MKKMTMNFTFGHCLTVPTHRMKMVTEHGSILELKVSNYFVHSLCLECVYNCFMCVGPCNTTVKFNIMNLNRQAKLYSQGMKPLYKVLPHQEQWERIKDKPLCSVRFYMPKYDFYL